MKPDRYLSLLTLAGWLLVPVAAWAVSVDQTPRPAFVLAGGAKCLVQVDRVSYGLYSVTDGVLVHRFAAPTTLGGVALSPDGKQVLISDMRGGVHLWEMDTGAAVWSRTPRQTGMSFAEEPAFSGDGKRFVVIDRFTSRALTFDTANGEGLGMVGLPTQQTSILSVALNPTGTGGVLVDLSQQLHRFDSPGGPLTDTSVRGIAPVCYAADGKHIALRSDEHLALVRVADMTRRDVGQFASIGLIRPAADGGFLLTVEASPRRVEGVYVSPEGDVRVRWSHAVGGLTTLTAFTLDAPVGVSTSFDYLTTIADLRTGQVVRTIDNSANWTSPVGAMWSMLLNGALLLGLLLIMAVGLWLRYRVGPTR